MIATILINAVAVWLGANILRGVEVNSFVHALIIGAVIGLLNWTLGSILHFLTAPVIWITFGFFGLVVDALILMVADYFLKSLKIRSFWSALALAVIITVVNMVIKFIF